MVRRSRYGKRSRRKTRTRRRKSRGKRRSRRTAKYVASKLPPRHLEPYGMMTGDVVRPGARQSFSQRGLLRNPDYSHSAYRTWTGWVPDSSGKRWRSRGGMKKTKSFKMFPSFRKSKRKSSRRRSKSRPFSRKKSRSRMMKPLSPRRRNRSTKRWASEPAWLKKERIAGHRVPDQFYMPGHAATSRYTPHYHKVTGAVGSGKFRSRRRPRRSSRRGSRFGFGSRWF